jgi:hypothetical protein
MLAVIDRFHYKPSGPSEGTVIDSNRDLSQTGSAPWAYAAGDENRRS